MNNPQQQTRSQRQQHVKTAMLPSVTRQVMRAFNVAHLDISQLPQRHDRDVGLSGGDCHT